MNRNSRRTNLCAAISRTAGIVALAALPALAAPANAEGLPGMRGHDHTGVTVPDMGQAVTFFTAILGCQKIMSFGPFSDDKGNFMKDALDVHPRAVITQITMVRCGFGSSIELFSYQSPDQQVVQPKNSDIGGYHIAIYVDDIKAADKYLRSKGVFTLFGPIPVTQGPAAGQTILYFKAPWGLQMEAISYPDGMAYEKDAPVKLWSPKDPAK
jgi:catechol 2,3-dioxygenase-like lactoylglutathione lyase family enzyme